MAMAGFAVVPANADLLAERSPVADEAARQLAPGPQTHLTKIPTPT
jgi:hypothetical protein